MELKPGYKQTEVGVIPEEWEVKALKEISPKQSVGLVINPSTYFDPQESIPMLVGSNVTENRIDAEAANRISAASNVKLAASRLTQGDLVTVRVGEPGVTAVIPPELDQCNCASMMIVRQDRSFNSHWLCSAMNSRHGRQQVENVQYGTAQKQFNIKDAVNFIYAVPPLQEQNQIATVLSELELLLRNLEQVITKKREIKQAAMQELLTGKRRLPGFEGEWVAGKLGDYVEKIVGGGTPSRANPGFWGGEIPWATVKDLTIFQPNQTQEWLTRDGLKNSSANLIPAGTLIASTRMALGKAVIFATDVAINQDLKAIFFGKNGMARFFCYWFEANASAIDAIGGGSTVKGISLSQLKALDVANPGLAEQNAIVDVISDIETEIETLENRLTKTRALKQAMMQELLTGRIRLR